MFRAGRKSLSQYRLRVTKLLYSLALLKDRPIFVRSTLKDRQLRGRAPRIVPRLVLDDGVQANGKLRRGEGVKSLVAQTDMSSGSVLRLADFRTSEEGRISISSAGDQVIVFAGSVEKPTYLCAINFEGSPGAWQITADSSKASALPTGLVNGQTALALSQTANAAYTGSATGSASQLRAAINDATHWIVHDSKPPKMPSLFIVTQDTSLSATSTTSTSTEAVTASVLKPGDCAIVGFKAVDPDDVAIVLLTDVPRGQQIFVTDDGVQANGQLRRGEGVKSLVSQTTMSSGTVLRLADFSTSEEGKMSISSAGDQVIVFAGSVERPTYLCAINFEGSAAAWQSTADSSKASALPTGLVNGQTALALSETANAIYTGSATGSASQLRAAINDATHWIVHDSKPPKMPSSFTITRDTLLSATSRLAMRDAPVEGGPHPCGDELDAAVIAKRRGRNSTDSMPDCHGEQHTEALLLGKWQVLGFQWHTSSGRALQCYLGVFLSVAGTAALWVATQRRCSLGRDPVISDLPEEEPLFANLQA
eukprot:TRINITY_DN3324_c0_g1_i1.p1 TRINITY_DN3324_c0_g1~~TRINITY_DN3324_c0_g1_i1.p1  ORF type:complete len:537 (-),score=76.98 TRINITY_DN3324_c0_g1_i1:15-1625(-)